MSANLNQVVDLIKENKVDNIIDLEEVCKKNEIEDYFEIFNEYSKLLKLYMDSVNNYKEVDQEVVVIHKWSTMSLQTAFEDFLGQILEKGFSDKIDLDLDMRLTTDNKYETLHLPKADLGRLITMSRRFDTMKLHLTSYYDQPNNKFKLEITGLTLDEVKDLEDITLMI